MPSQPTLGIIVQHVNIRDANSILHELFALKGL